MRDVGLALASGLWAPVRRPKLVLALWLTRLLPILLFFTLPVVGAAYGDIGRNPQARAVLDAHADQSGFAWAFENDFFATRFDAADRVFWLCLACWLLVSVLTGGLIAAFIQQPEAPLLSHCGRYAGRFLRLAVVAAVLVYLADAAVNGILAAHQAEIARLHFTQDYAVRRAAGRAVLFPALVVLIHAVQSYAGIDIVANERRSALLAFGRGFGTLLMKLPKLLVLELAMLVAAGVAVVVAWLLVVGIRPATWLSFAVFVAALALGSYLRTGIELGTLEARCRLLLPPAPPLSPLETVLGTPAPPA